MAQLIKPNQVKLITEKGECNLHITLDLNINLNTGKLEINAKENYVKEEKEDVSWEIPEFKPTKKIQFGKKE